MDTGIRNAIAHGLKSGWNHPMIIRNVSMISFQDEKEEIEQFFQYIMVNKLPLSEENLNDTISQFKAYKLTQEPDHK